MLRFDHDAAGAPTGAVLDRCHYSWFDNVSFRNRLTIALMPRLGSIAGDRCQSHYKQRKANTCVHNFTVQFDQPCITGCASVVANRRLRSKSPAPAMMSAMVIFSLVDPIEAGKIRVDTT